MPARFLVLWVRAPVAFRRAAVEMVVLEQAWPPQTVPANPRMPDLFPALLLELQGADDPQEEYGILFPKLARKYPIRTL